MRKIIAMLLALNICFAPLLVEADETEELENKKAVIDSKAEKAKQKSDELWEKIESVSEQKRYLDEEADAEELHRLNKELEGLRSQTWKAADQSS